MSQQATEGAPAAQRSLFGGRGGDGFMLHVYLYVAWAVLVYVYIPYINACMYICMAICRRVDFVASTYEDMYYLSCSCFPVDVCGLMQVFLGPCYLHCCFREC